MSISSRAVLPGEPFEAGELARAMASASYEGGTYAVHVAPSYPEGVAFSAYPFPSSGRFVVGGGSADGARVFPADLSRRPGDRGVGVVYRALVAMAVRAGVIGAWRDSQGRLWIDEVDTYGHVGDALLVALARGELAIWDSREGREIEVNSDLSRQWATARALDDQPGFIHADVDVAAVEERAEAGQS